MTAANTEIIKRIKAAIGTEPPLFTVRSSIKTSVMMQDGAYRTKPIDAEDELILKGVREGARGFIFEFEPLEAKEYKQVEISKEAMFECLPAFEEYLVAALGFTHPGRDDNGDPADIVDDISWKEAVKRFTAEFKEEVRATTEESYKDNPLWGLF